MDDVDIELAQLLADERAKERLREALAASAVPLDPPPEPGTHGPTGRQRWSLRLWLVSSWLLFTALVAALVAFRAGG